MWTRRERLGHILFGTHSNIPLCCVFAWVDGVNIAHQEGIGYIRCRDCVEKDRRVEVHICNPYAQRGCLKVIKMLDAYGWRLMDYYFGEGSEVVKRGVEYTWRQHD